jgi:hypothetical protein
MKELKEYLTPELLIVEIGDYVFTGDSQENNHIDDPYGSGDKWWE